jgi:hypothetical protein
VDPSHVTKVTWEIVTGRHLKIGDRNGRQGDHFYPRSLRETPRAPAGNGRRGG